MLQLPKNKIAVTPLFDPDESGFIGIDGQPIIVPDMAKERCDQGIVKYIGAGVDEKINVGDHVLFSGYTGTLMKLEDEGLLIILPAEFITALIIYNQDFDIPGLWFQSVDGSYFEATYEMAIELIAKAVQEQGWYKNFSVKHELPKVEDYEKWHS